MQMYHNFSDGKVCASGLFEAKPLFLADSPIVGRLPGGAGFQTGQIAWLKKAEIRCSTGGRQQALKKDYLSSSGR